MAFDKPPGAAKPMPPGVQGSQRPDPLIQPALANAMRLGKAFAKMSPPGSRAGMQPQRQGQTPPGGQTF